MCGISGIYGQALPLDAESIIHKMNDCIAHRGPDDAGFYNDANVALGHRRLAILDLSPAGHQPMFDASGKIAIVYNGEIYNFLEVRKKLTNYPFKSQSDTEVILAAYLEWGVDCLKHFNGMFAFALWDIEKKELFIARDRLGVKPLYYTEKNGVLYFASEVRSILASGNIDRKINRDVIAEYFTYQTVHAPSTLVKDVYMLMPGHYMLIKNGELDIKRWWSARENYSTSSGGKSYEEVCKDVYQLLMASVERRLISDVPFGAFLSGGIDSSAIVGLMSKVQQQPVKTFTIIFDEEEFSEAKYARIVADLFKTDHHEFRLTPDDFLRDLPIALNALDHPSGDGPNSYIVSRITREAGITMALSGLGGDEFFAGYPVFNRSLQIQNKKWLFSIPAPVRKLAGVAYAGMKSDITSDKMVQLLNQEDHTLNSSFPLSRQVGLPQHVKGLLGINKLPADAIKSILNTELSGRAAEMPELGKVSIAEMSTYMQNVLLRDADQMSMAVALEVRVPFLDYELVEYVLGIKDEFKKPTFPKKLLVDSLQGLLPDEIVHRKKMGFVFPWNVWLKKELKPLCEKNIQQLANRDFIDGGYLMNAWNRFQEGDQQVRWLDMWLCTVLESWMNKNGIES